MKEQILAYFVSKYPHPKAIHSIETYLGVSHLAPLCNELVDEGKLQKIHHIFYHLKPKAFDTEFYKINPRTLGDRNER